MAVLRVDVEDLKIGDLFLCLESEAREITNVTITDRNDGLLQYNVSVKGVLYPLMLVTKPGSDNTVEIYA